MKNVFAATVGATENGLIQILVANGLCTLGNLPSHFDQRELLFDWVGSSLAELRSSDSRYRYY
jgi:hypothetical protein